MADDLEGDPAIKIVLDGGGKKSGGETAAAGRHPQRWRSSAAGHDGSSLPARMQDPWASWTDGPWVAIMPWQ
jgi:hypothetical protein